MGNCFVLHALTNNYNVKNKEKEHEYGFWYIMECYDESS